MPPNGSAGGGGGGAAAAAAQAPRPLSKVLAEQTDPPDPSTSLPLRYYSRSARNTLRQVAYYRREGDERSLYVLLMRTAGLIIDTIPAHPGYKDKRNAALVKGEIAALRREALSLVEEAERLRPRIDALGEAERKAEAERKSAAGEARRQADAEERRRREEKEREMEANAQRMAEAAAVATAAETASGVAASEVALPWDGLALNDGFCVPGAGDAADSAPDTPSMADPTDLLSASPAQAAEAATRAARSVAPALVAPGVALARSGGAHSVLGPTGLGTAATGPVVSAQTTSATHVSRAPRPASYPTATIDSAPPVFPAGAFRPARRRSPPPARASEPAVPPDWSRAFPQPQPGVSGALSSVPVAGPAAQGTTPQGGTQLPSQRPLTPADAAAATAMASSAAAYAASAGPRNLPLPPQPTELLQPTPLLPGGQACCSPGPGALVAPQVAQLAPLVGPEEAPKVPPGWAVTGGQGVHRKKDGPRAVHFSPHLLREFMRLARRNTTRGIETCAVLAGKISQGAFFVTLLVVPKQEGTANSCNTLNEEEIFEVQDKHELFSLGWIHTHPTQTCFMSSIDVHTHCAYQTMLPEAIAVVMAPTDPRRKCGVFQLTSPNGGLQAVQRCAQRGFHAHPPLRNGKPYYDDASHVMLDERCKFACMDLRS